MPPESWTSIEAFFGLRTQWQLLVVTDPAGARLIRTGLNYQGVESYLRMRQIESAAVLDDLQVMETAALDTFSEVASA